ncbi:alpha/beta-hydrolase [Hortaea werneckii]|nr:alpha/beta-hydrolase [Hortaea werneckii]KAI7557570.1 alpha/beta-hydrolase [Hortaea werneckii]KAI7604532.1 alpha/beta-hydrolase [Hortaea werneckii]KAI7625960.1 alpha/beta-hydrolase [Hortaea werneckii]KAI7648045.1 alpha/beta-hydrolase [Hortaea werneckii]
MSNLTGASVLALSLTALNLATAQNLSYGADNFYHSDNITLWPITFPTIYHTTVAGNLFLPDFLDYSANNSAIVVSHPMEQGFVTISIDIPFYGGSEGQPINSVLPDLYSEAVSAAVDYLGMQSYVDRRRIGAVGICGSSGFVVSAAKIDPRISTVATASMYDMGAVNRNGLMHSRSVHERKEVIARAAEQRWIEVAGAETSYQLGTPLHLTNTSTAIDREFYDYYCTSRGEVTPPGSAPNITTGSSVTSNAKFMNLYPFDDIETISPRPMLFITGDVAHSREFSADAYARAAEPKEIMWIPGAGHVDLYDRVDLIPFARLFDFFRTNLAGNSTRLPLE